MRESKLTVDQALVHFDVPTIYALAKKLGVNASSIHKIERANAHIYIDEAGLPYTRHYLKTRK